MFSSGLLALLWLCLPVAVEPAAQDAPVGRTFVDSVYPVLEKAECRACHNENGVSSATRLVFPPPEASADDIEAFGLNLAILIDRANPEQSLLVRKPTRRIAHAGGERIRSGSAEEETLRQWVRRLAALPEHELRSELQRLRPSERAATRAPALRRLTHSQYNNTVRDLLGDLTRPADYFPQEDYLGGFTNQMESQSIPPLLAEAYTVAAEKLAGSALRRGEIQRLVPCKPAAASGAACRDAFIRRFGLRAFRRPLTDDEVRGYAGLFRRVAAGPEGALAGAKVVVEAMLQSPSFLFHLEDGPDGRWRPYAIGSRLSYFLWDTTPSDELLRAAAAGELERTESVRRTARRMMDDPRAKRALDVFLAQWMRFDRVLGSARSVRRYPDFGPSLLAAMTEETRHLFHHLVWNDGNFMEFFDADYTFASARLAQLYGWPTPQQEFARVQYPAGSNRAGVLGHASLLTATGNPTETSPTARGLFVREHFLCQHVPPPPPGVDTTLPPVTAERPMTTRDRLAVHTTSAACATCHSLIDPIGLGLEGFDNIGRSRDKVSFRIQQERDAVTNEPRPPKTFELALDTKGYIQGIPSSQFSTAAELGNILAKDPTCQRCVVKQIFRYAVGRHEGPADQRTIDALFDRFRQSGFRFRELLVALATSEPFLGESRSAQTVPSAAAGGGKRPIASPNRMR